MNELQMYELSAQALGWKTKVVNFVRTNIVFYQRDVSPKPDWQEWDPLKNDGQALLLMRELRLSVWPRDDAMWRAVPSDAPMVSDIAGVSENLNRAIVECAAMMQEAKCLQT